MHPSNPALALKPGTRPTPVAQKNRGTPRNAARCPQPPYDCPRIALALWGMRGHIGRGVSRGALGSDEPHRGGGLNPDWRLHLAAVAELERLADSSGGVPTTGDLDRGLAVVANRQHSMSITGIGSYARPEVTSHIPWVTETRTTPRVRGKRQRWPLERRIARREPHVVLAPVVLSVIGS